MKTKNIIIIVGLIMIIVGLSGFSSKLLNYKSKQQYPKEQQADINVYETNYNYVLLYIMYSEDLLYKPSNKLTGLELVGFGHAVKNGEHFNNLSYREAFDLLQVDYCKCIDIAIDAGYCMQDNKQLAVALMFYNMKQGSVKKILSNISNIDKYIYYTKDGKSRMSKNLINNRAFEKELYFSKGIINLYKFM